MIRVNFIVPTIGDSFYYSAKYTISWLDPSRIITMLSSRRYIYGAINIKINDMWKEFIHPSKADIYWLDTPLFYNDIYNDIPLKRIKPRLILVTSRWNMDMCRQYFGDKCVLLPRLISPIYLSYTVNNDEKQYDLAFIGVSWFRKGADLFERVCRELNLRCWKTGRYNALSIYDIVYKLSKTRFLFWCTRGEGFGLPLAEAQALGIPAICIKAHANIDYCYSAKYDKNLWVRINRTYIWNDHVGNRHLIFEPDYNDLKDTIRYALTMDMRQYKKISSYIRNKISELMFYTANKLHNILMGDIT